jgi:hypothetical protein
MGLIILAVCIVVTTVVWQAFINVKRPERKRELSHHIDMILDPHGCRHAMRHYKACTHILEYYGIEPREVGFNGDLDDLFMLVDGSLSRALARENTAKQEFLSAQGC